MSNKIKRSDKYDFFKGTINNQKKPRTPKEKFKFIFKFVKIAFYLFLLSLSLTGCIQSIAIKSSSTTGSGIEFYRSNDDIAPFVTTYKIVEHKDNDGVITHQLTPDTKVNYLVTNADESISQLRQQIKNHQPSSNQNQELYGLYDNYSSSLRIVNSNDDLIANTLDINDTSKTDQLIRGTGNGNFLFLNSSMLEEMNKSSDYSYENVNELIQIPIFIKPRPPKSATQEEKDQWEKNPSIGGEFIPYHEDGTTKVEKDEEGYYLKIDGDRYDPSLESDRELISKFLYKFAFEVVYVTISLDNKLSAEKFSRDYLQSIVNVIMQFGQFKALDELPVNPPTDESKNIDKSITEKRLDNLNALVSDPIDSDSKNHILSFDSNHNINNGQIKTDNARYTNEMRNAILNYLNNVVPFISNSGYSIPKLKYDDLTPLNFNFGVENKNSHNILTGGATIGQKPIVTWSDAWALGPFYGFVVYPISFMVNSLVGSLPLSMGGGAALLAIVISVIAARMLTLLLTYKSVFAQVKQQTLAPKKAKIDAKYAPYKGNKQMDQRKRQETSELYKKNNINMLTPLLSSLVSMPIFLSMWRVIQGVPLIKSTSIWGINFSQTSWQELFAGEWQYLILIILAVVVQAGSQYLPRYLSKKRMQERSNVAEKEAMKKANRTQNIMMAIFIFMAVIFEAGVQIYWIVGGIWTMSQTLLIHHIQKTKFFKEKLIKYV